MKKSELIKALANVSDDTEILFGSPKEESLGSISSKIYKHWDGTIIITNEFTDPKPLCGCELIYML